MECTQRPSINSLFRKAGIVRGNIIEDVKRIFEVFSVDNLDDFFGLKAEEMELSYYRKSEKVKTNPVDILSWKYYCYHLSKMMIQLYAHLTRGQIQRCWQES